VSYSPAPNINIFLSYASEDQVIADAVADMIRKGFYDKFDITMMSEFPVGINWRSKIDDSIVVTDIMIAIATGRLKPGHSFTGYEIGSFMMSKRINPNMRVGSNLPRRMIPFATLDRTPSTVNDFEGIDIDPQSLHTVRFDPSDTVAEVRNLSTDGSDTATKAVVKLLNDIQDLVNDVFPGSGTTHSESQNRVEFFNTLAKDLCRQIFDDISNREMTVSIPKSKLIIRVQPTTLPGQDMLKTATVETQGPCYDSFGLHQENQAFDWSGFLNLATVDGISYSWNEAFRSLLISSSTSEFVENNTILSFDGKKAFRIFVARVTTLFSGVREYQVYVIPLLRPKDYGDPQTSALLRALQVSLGYRFMFLEATSPFSPTIMRATQLADFQSAVSTMQNSLNLLLQAADDSGLGNPGMVVSLLGVDGIEDVYASWDAEKKKLNDAVERILAESPDDTIKSMFVVRLATFCDCTRELNKRYTASVMTKLQAYISAGN
jgi:hypothetical protein